MKAFFRHVLGLLLVLPMASPLVGFAQANPNQATYQQGWDSYKPSDLFIKATKELMQLGYAPKDTMNILAVYTTIDSSDVGPTALSSLPQFKKVVKVWSTVIRSQAPVTFSVNYYNTPSPSKRQAYPFVGIEEWVFPNEDAAKTCMQMLRTGNLGGKTLSLQKPPREFVRDGNQIYYFYTFPIDFYADMAKARETFIKYMANPDVLKIH